MQERPWRQGEIKTLEQDIKIHGNQFTSILLNIKDFHFDYMFYRSESPSQVFLILISWLHETLAKIETEEWSDVLCWHMITCVI